MSKRLSFILVSVAALLGTSPAGAATILTFSSDADFLANVDFVKEFGGNVRWGNGATNGDWEYSVVDGNDIPMGAGNPRQHAWAAGPSTNDHAVSFDWDGSGTLTLDPSLPAGASSETGLTPGTINALAIRARASSGDAANLLSPITISFDAGGTDVVLGPLSGDSDAEYIVVIDSRLASGFELTANAQIGDGNGSLPQYGFKVGSVPEPGTLLLLGSALFGWTVRRRA